jgi:type 1 glutamine amidotransferase
MKLLVLSGGRHPYEESTPLLLNFLRDGGHDVQMTEDACVLLTDAMATFDAIVFNTRREGEMTLTKAEQVALTRFVGGGRGFVCLHIASCRPESWPGYHDLTGGGWITGSSCHPPYGQFTLDVKNLDHRCAEGISEFVTNDEMYIQLDMKPGNDVFLTAELEEGTHIWGGTPTLMAGGTYPMAWTRAYGNGRVFTTTLGHNGLSFQTPEFQRLVLNGVGWATDKG